MLSPDEMRELLQSEGRAFDLLWTERMIFHHEGAISSAEGVLDAGQHPRVAQLARDIIAEQKSEIDRMQDMRATWQSESATG